MATYNREVGINEMPISPLKSAIDNEDSKDTDFRQHNTDIKDIRSTNNTSEMTAENILQAVSIQSASGKDVSVSEKAKKQAVLLFNDMKFEEAHEAQNASVGFKSASGKSVVISEKGKNKAQKLFEERENQVSKTISEHVDCSSVHRESEKITFCIAEELNTQGNDKAAVNDIQQFVSFQSAGGKKIMFSEKAKSKAVRLIAQIDTECDSTNKELSFLGFQSASGKAIHMSEQAQRKAERLIEEVRREVENDSVNAIVKRPSDGNGNSFRSPNIQNMTKDYSKIPKGFRPFKPPKVTVLSNQGNTGNNVEITKIRASNSVSFRDTTSNNKKEESQPDEFNDSFDGFTSTQMVEIVDTANVFLQSDDELVWTQMPRHIQTESEDDASDSEVTFKDNRIKSQQTGKLASANPSTTNRPVALNEAAETNKPMDNECNSKLVENDKLEGERTCNDTIESKIEDRDLSKHADDSGLGNHRHSANESVWDQFEMNDTLIRLTDEVTKEDAVDQRESSQDTGVPIEPKTECTSPRCMHDDDVNNVLNTSENCYGFVTANGYAISIQDESLNAARKLLGDINDKRESEPILLSPDDTTISKREALYEKAEDLGPVMSKSNGQKISKCSDDQKDVGTVPSKSQTPDEKDEHTDKRTENPFSNNAEYKNNDASLCFQTASGKTVTAPESTLTKVRTMFSEPTIETIWLSNAEETTDKYSQGKNSYVTFVNSNVQRQPKPFAGFQTTAGVGVKVSQSSLEKVRNLFASDLSQSREGKHKAEDETYGRFSTAGGNQLPVSKEDLGRAKGVLAEMESNKGDLKENSHVLQEEPITTLDQNNTNPTGFMGFHTAGGTKVNVLKASLDKAKKLFTEDCQDNKQKPMCEFSTAGGNCVAISSAASEKVKNKFGPQDGDINGQNIHNIQRERDNTQIGFQTASGNKVSVSSDTLKKIRSIFEQQMGQHNERRTDGKEGETAGTVPSTNMEALKGACFCGNMCKFNGFSTASGNRVSVSNAALKKAKAFFGDEDTKEADDNAIVPTNKESFGFQTAGGSSVTVSKSALEGAKCLLRSRDSKETNLEEILTTTISKSANFSQNECNSEERDTTPEYSLGQITAVPSGGFQTARGCQVMVSESALREAHRFMNQLELEVNAANDQEMTENHISFTEFSTARGNRVEVSKTALKLAKRFLADNHDNNTEQPITPEPDLTGMNADQLPSDKLNERPQGFAGFQTGRGEAVPVSEEAMAKAQLFVTENTETLQGYNDKESRPLRDVKHQVDIEMEASESAKVIV